MAARTQVALSCLFIRKAIDRLQKGWTSAVLPALCSICRPDGEEGGGGGRVEKEVGRSGGLVRGPSSWKEDREKGRAKRVNGEACARQECCDVSADFIYAQHAMGKKSGVCLGAASADCCCSSAGAINNAAAPPFGSLDLAMRTRITFRFRECTGETACCSSEHAIQPLEGGAFGGISVQATVNEWYA